MKESPRNAFFYVSDDGDIMAVRAGDWKLVFAEQRAHHDAGVGGADREAAGAAHLQPASRSVRARQLQLQRLLGLAGRSRPTALSGAGARGRRRSTNFVKYPPRQKPASFNLDAVLRAVGAGDRGGKRGRGKRSEDEERGAPGTHSREVDEDLSKGRSPRSPFRRG